MDPAQHSDTDGNAGAIVRAAGREIRDEAVRTAESAKDSALRAAEEQKTLAVAFMRDLSRAIRKGAQELRDGGRDRSALYVERTGDGLDRLCGRLDGQAVDSLLDDAKDFARRRRGLLFGAALLAGFGVVRFAMSSSPSPGRHDGGGPASDPTTSDPTTSDPTTRR